MRILVLDGNQNQAVACVRSLAAQGHTVLAGESKSWSKAGWSRSCSASFRYAPPEKDAEKFLHDVLAEARKQPGTLVMPMTEATTALISAHRELFTQAQARFVLPSHADLLRAFDKRQTTELAQSLGVAVPKTTTITTPAELQAAIEQMQFPLVLKPRTSQEQSAQGATRATGRPRYAKTAAQAQAAFTEMQQHCSNVLIQEFIEGAGAGYFALMNHGELRAEFAHRRLRDLHPTGSGSVLRESTLPPPQIRESSLALLRALNWHGVAMVEFRLRADGVPFFLEVNGRFWHSLPLACYAGADFPALLAQIAEYGDITSPPSYRIGVRCRWLVGDFRHFLAVCQGRPKGYPGKFPSRLATLVQLADWIRFVQQVWESRSQ
jgi:predicted ATP-grasp superfamily ATP-dependent carboligase